MRLIDADALEELFREVIGSLSRKTDCNLNFEYMIRSSAMTIEMIKDAPTIDAVEVVRCKDCKYYTSVTAHCETRGKGLYLIRGKEDYCSRAERRNDDSD